MASYNIHLLIIQTILPPRPWLVFCLISPDNNVYVWCNILTMCHVIIIYHNESGTGPASVCVLPFI